MEGVGKLVLLTTCQTLCARKYKKQKKPHNGWIITFVLPVQSAANNKIVCVVIPGKMLLFILPRVLHWALQEYRCKGQGSHSKGLFTPFGKINQSKLFRVFVVYQSTLYIEAWLLSSDVNFGIRISENYWENDLLTSTGDTYPEACKEQGQLQS